MRARRARVACRTRRERNRSQRTGRKLFEGMLQLQRNGERGKAAEKYCEDVKGKVEEEEGSTKSGSTETERYVYHPDE